VRFAAAALFAVVALAGCGSEEAADVAAPPTATATEPQTEPSTPAVTEAETEPATTAEPEAECSTSGLRLTLPEQDLPEPVAETRQRIFEAALACDYETLESLAGEEGFTFSYGGTQSAAAFWRMVEEEQAGPQPLPMRALATILTMQPTRNESGSYAWPDAYTESPSDEAWQALVDAGLYTEEQIESMRAPESTGYLGYRTAITPDGVWQFFVAGD
jgi:hypothetical protein